MISLKRFSISFEKHWLNRAYDNYVLSGADLEEELLSAQTYITEYRECISGLPLYDRIKDSYEDYYAQLYTCFVTVDPTMY